MEESKKSQTPENKLNIKRILFFENCLIPAFDIAPKSMFEIPSIGCKRQILFCISLYFSPDCPHLPSHSGQKMSCSEQNLPALPQSWKFKHALSDNN
ncbi:MAG: hypothetical protein GY705_06435 [Bacteroidetes bacterium]|nr:hypothetical protein [Bacteroidota bacterium]